ncbi:hypothetical protein MFIFM68171_04902 [Madurella fahalii]|uniref:Uncharacterized protein n=1 Tax=Madurella fahalii TaxID=1157608 RepID=A0ABQ0GAA9_9PEZI
MLHGFPGPQRSVDYKMVDVTGYGSRLQNDITAHLVCEVRVNCSYTLTAPFSLVVEGITAVQGSFLGCASATPDPSSRIISSDGLGLVQMGDTGQTFSLVAFAGDIRATGGMPPGAETRGWENQQMQSWWY